MSHVDRKLDHMTQMLQQLLQVQQQQLQQQQQPSNNLQILAQRAGDSSPNKVTK